MENQNNQPLSRKRSNKLLYILITIATLIIFCFLSLCGIIFAIGNSVAPSFSRYNEEFPEKSNEIQQNNNQSEPLINNDGAENYNNSRIVGLNDLVLTKDSIKTQIATNLNLPSQLSYELSISNNELVITSSISEMSKFLDLNQVDTNSFNLDLNLFTQFFPSNNILIKAGVSNDSKEIVIKEITSDSALVNTLLNNQAVNQLIQLPILTVNDFKSESIVDPLSFKIEDNNLTLNYN